MRLSCWISTSIITFRVDAFAALGGSGLLEVPVVRRGRATAVSASALPPPGILQSVACARPWSSMSVLFRSHSLAFFWAHPWCFLHPLGLPGRPILPKHSQRARDRGGRRRKVTLRSGSVLGTNADYFSLLLLSMHSEFSRSSVHFNVRHLFATYVRSRAEAQGMKSQLYPFPLPGPRPGKNQRH